MEKKITRLILMQVVLLGFSLLFNSTNAFSQCTAVKSENGKVVRVTIPCDFPIATVADTSSMTQALDTWYSKNPTLQNVVITPMSAPGNTIIEIPFTIYNKFSDPKKKTINAISYFYKVINQN